MNKYRLISVLLLVGILLAACKPAEEIVAEPLTVVEEETANTAQPTEEPQVTEETDELIASETADCRVLQDPVFPYHVVMITDDGFVYHTGPNDENDGYLRLWKESVYFDAAPLIWLPVKENPSFLGVYRFKFLND